MKKGTKYAASNKLPSNVNIFVLKDLVLKSVKDITFSFRE